MEGQVGGPGNLTKASVRGKKNHPCFSSIDIRIPEIENRSENYERNTMVVTGDQRSKAPSYVPLNRLQGMILNTCKLLTNPTDVSDTMK